MSNNNLTEWESQLIELIRRYPAAAGEMATALRIAMQSGLITEQEAWQQLREQITATLNDQRNAAEGQDPHEHR
jgi:hypothetical protein